MDLLYGYREMSGASHVLMLTILGVLVLASALISAANLIRRNEETRKLVAIIKSWWVMIGLIFITLSAGTTVFLVFIGVVSFLALREFVAVLPLSPQERKVYPLLYLLVPAYFFQIAGLHAGGDRFGDALAVAPVVVLYAISTAFLFLGSVSGYLRSISLCAMGFFLTIFNLSHVSLLLYLPKIDAGVVLFLLFIVQFNDVAQWFWGRFFGKTKIVPAISPNKTVAGLVGGMMTTSLLSGLLGPQVLGVQTTSALWMGLVLSFLGFLGDITLSAIKRDSNIKDFSSLIPGHGGVLDRVDSLVFTAPAFYYLMRYL